MKKLHFAAAISALLASPSAHAKDIDASHMTSAEITQLRDADSFSVECRHGNVTDRESVDVDAATVTIEVPGKAPEVHHVTNGYFDIGDAQDRFGKPLLRMRLKAVFWGAASLVWNGGSDQRWFSSHADKTLWTCAN